MSGHRLRFSRNGYRLRTSETTVGLTSPTSISVRPDFAAITSAPSGSIRCESPEYLIPSPDPTLFTPITYAWFSMARAVSSDFQWCARVSGQFAITTYKSVLGAKSQKSGAKRRSKQIKKLTSAPAIFNVSVS